jgi:hypothetical protein
MLLVTIFLHVAWKKKGLSRSVQGVVAVGAGNVERSSALFTTILRQARRHLLLEKLTMQNVVKKSMDLSKTTIVQVVIIVILALDGSH